MTPTPTVTLSVRIPPELYAQLIERAKAEGRSLKSLVVELLGAGTLVD